MIDNMVFQANNGPYEKILTDKEQARGRSTCFCHGTGIFLLKAGGEKQHVVNSDRRRCNRPGRVTFEQLKDIMAEIVKPADAGRKSQCQNSLYYCGEKMGN